MEWTTIATTFITVSVTTIGMMYSAVVVARINNPNARANDNALKAVQNNTQKNISRQNGGWLFGWLSGKSPKFWLSSAFLLFSILFSWWVIGTMPDDKPLRRYDIFLIGFCAANVHFMLWQTINYWDKTSTRI